MSQYVTSGGIYMAQIHNERARKSNREEDGKEGYKGLQREKSRTTLCADEKERQLQRRKKKQKKKQ